MNRWVVSAAVAAVFSSPGLLPAAAAEDANEALLGCASEKDDARRLRCFDAVVGSLRRAAAAPSASVAATPSAPPATPPPAVSREEKFGARGDLDKEKREELKEITGKVTEVGALPYGELVITLDNGQVWAERTANSKVKVKVGDTVKIEAGALGSFTLVAPNGRSSKVARVR
jgi:translation initiation factor IF-1